MILGKLLLRQLHANILRLTAGQRNGRNRRKLLQLRLYPVLHIIMEISLRLIRNGKNHAGLCIDIKLYIRGILGILGEIRL